MSIPVRYSLAPDDGSNVETPLGRLPIIATIIGGFAAQLLGIAQQSLETIFQLGRTQTSDGAASGTRARARVQLEVASAVAGLAAARASLLGSGAILWGAAEQGRDPDRKDLALHIATALHSNEIARKTVDAMYAAGGTSSLYVDSMLERAHRDMHAMLRHVVAQPVWLEDAGRVLMDLDPLDVSFTI